MADRTAIITDESGVCAELWENSHPCWIIRDPNDIIIAVVPGVHEILDEGLMLLAYGIERVNDPDVDLDPILDAWTGGTALYLWETTANVHARLERFRVSPSTSPLSCLVSRTSSISGKEADMRSNGWAWEWTTTAELNKGHQPRQGYVDFVDVLNGKKPLSELRKRFFILADGRKCRIVGEGTTEDGKKGLRLRFMDGTEEVRPIHESSH